MAHGKSIRIFLHSGNVTGIKTAEVYNWTGQAISCPRKRVGELQALSSQLPGYETGVYLLFGVDNGRRSVYIGESTQTIKRIGQHIAEKDFWNEAVIFNNKDQNLTKGHAQYLEAKLIAQTEKTDRFNLKNKDAPNAPQLAYAEQAAMDEFMENMRLVLGALGYKVLEPISTSGQKDESKKQGYETTPRDYAQTSDLLDTRLYFKGRDFEAEGYMTDEGFVVSSGSVMSREAASSLSDNYSQKRKNLISDEFVADEEGEFTFSKDYLFSSSSYAASVVSGSTRSGPASWKDKDGNSLSDLESKVSDSLEEAQE